MDITVIRSLVTVAAFITFIGIVAWAWSSKRTDEFDEAARIPFNEDDEVEANNQEMENPHA